MNFLKDYRNPRAVLKLAEEIKRIVGEKQFKIMEVCGGQTHTLYKYQLYQLLPETLKMVSGPGCPVCVTPIQYIDTAVAIGMQYDVTVFTFGDLIRVPGTRISLEQARAKGARIQQVYSPLQAFEYAKKNPKRNVVFLGIGFETTLPTFLLAIEKAHKQKINNFSVLISAKRVPPVLDALMQSKEIMLDGFISPGHVTSIIGTNAYEQITNRYSIPVVTGGFEPVDLMIAIRDLALLLTSKKVENSNAYKRVTNPSGNVAAKKLIETLCTPCDDELRGLGVVKQSGYGLRREYDAFDAQKKYPVQISSKEASGCICGQVLSGVKHPHQCPLFATACTPQRPIGACMVSNEGTCNAAYLYQLDTQEKAIQ